jgi:hypothetical protein
MLKTSIATPIVLGLAIAAGHLYLEAGRTLEFTLSEPAAFALRAEEGN